LRLFTVEVCEAWAGWHIVRSIPNVDIRARRQDQERKISQHVRWEIENENTYFMADNMFYKGSGCFLLDGYLVRQYCCKDIGWWKWE
jgi:hypothetical protein